MLYHSSNNLRFSQLVSTLPQDVDLTDGKTGLGSAGKNLSISEEGAGIKPSLCYWWCQVVLFADRDDTF